MPEKRLRLHERLSENYLSVNFSTLYLTVLKVRTIMYLEIRKEIKKRNLVSKLTPLETTMQN